MKRGLNGQLVSNDPYAFMTEPQKSVRTYDSTLSHPGRFCSNCRGFVGGDLKECPVCNSAEPIMFDSVAFNSLNHHHGALNA